MATAIQEQIKTLVDLQKIDAEIYQLKKELDRQPGLQKKIEVEFEAKKNSLKRAEDALKALQAKQRDRENDLAQKETKTKKLQAQLYQLKTNKEYSTMDLEIKGLRADQSVMEEEILRLLDEVDQARAQVTREKELLAGEEKKMKEATEAIKKRASELSTDVSGHEDRRKTFLPGVDGRLLGQYEKILKNREGLALTPVVNDSCGGCHMELPPQAVNEIQLQEKIIVCESCARILYWPG